MRTVYDLNQNWLFSKSCTAAPVELPSGGDWESVTLPHSWNAIDCHMGVPYERGAYWYVTSVKAPRQPLPGGRTYIEVGAAGLAGEIWVNGQFITRHVGGYSAFRADITDALTHGENTLAILCDNRYSDEVYPQRADFVFHGGLYRHVRMISVAESRFTLDDFGGCGVYVDSEPADGGAAVSVRALINNTKERQTVGLQIIDENGDAVAEAWAFAEETTCLKTFIPDAKLWNGPGEGSMYTAKLQLVSYNEVLDEIETAFGVRSFSIDKETGFYLNGRSMPLRGACRHQDRLYMGSALEREAHFEDAKLIADMGANCVRLAHYQQSHDIYEAFDRLGLVVWAEIPYFTNTWNDTAHGHSVNEIRELVVQNYNHPSICFWGLSNEILMGGNDSPKLVPCHNDLENAVKAIDAKRFTVVAHEYSARWDHPLHDIPDTEGWNHYYGWYRGDLNSLAEWCDEYHAAHPERLFSISEYGCDGILGYHSDDPAKNDYTEEYQVLLHESACETFASRPWIWGTFIWNMFDFGSFFRREGGTRGRNNKGMVTLDRKIKKDAYYVYKAWYGKDPFVHIAGRRYFRRPGETCTLRIHSNQSKVSLYADGRLLGTQSGEHVFVFENVPLSKCGTILTARAGSCSDTITLYACDELPAEFTFPDFRQAQDAKNWFDSVEEAAGALETKPGYFSVHDTAGEIRENAAAKKVCCDCFTAAVGRVMGESHLFGGDPSLSMADTLNTGMMPSFLADKHETTLRRMHAALSQIKKD